MIVSWNTTNDCNMFCDHWYRDAGCEVEDELNTAEAKTLLEDEIWRKHKVLQTLRTLDYKGGCGSCEYKRACGGYRARAAYYNEGDYMAEEPWCLYHGRKVV